MSFAALGLLTSDPNLLACELLRLEGTVGLGETGDGWRASLGSYAQDTTLLKAYPAGEGPGHIRDLRFAQESPVLLFHAQPGSIQPLRFRPWMFVVGGQLPKDPRWRETWAGELPDYLRNQLAAWGSAETVFAHFLKELRDIGQTEDPRLTAKAAGEMLGATTRKLGGENVVLLATNGHLLLGARTGTAPLFFSLLEGSGTCPRHRLSGPTVLEGDPRVRQHHKCRSLAIASHPQPGRSWREIAPGQVLSTDERLALCWYPL